MVYTGYLIEAIIKHETVSVRTRPHHTLRRRRMIKKIDFIEEINRELDMERAEYCVDMCEAQDTYNALKGEEE